MSKISILLSTYNGEKYIKEQLDSLFSQTYKDFEIIVRDDISSDKTLEILKSYDVKIIESIENLGAKKSFSTLLEYALHNGDSDYFMFCDQDDIWNDDKIEKTLIKMQNLEKKYGNIPLLVHTDLEVVDEKLKTIHNSMWEYEYILPKCNRLNRLLIQNTITGCTMMINRKLAKKSFDIPKEAIMHDWWIGLVTGYFGRIGYINESTIKYRQHGNNTIGAKGFQINILRHTLSLMKSLIFKDITYLNHIQINIVQAKAFLEQFRNELDDETIKMLEDFTALEQKSWSQKRTILLKYKLLKQGFIRNAGLFLKI